MSLRELASAYHWVRSNEIGWPHEFDVGRCCFIGVVVIAGMPKTSEAAPAGTAPLTMGLWFKRTMKRAFPPPLRGQGHLASTTAEAMLEE